MNLIRNFLYATLALLTAALSALSAEPPFDSVNWNQWSWTAPNPPLPNTEWYDYGWDSTSNGPTPAETRQRIAGLERSPLRLAQGRAVMNPPPLPPLPPHPAIIPGPTNAAGNIEYVSLTAPPTRPGRLYADTFLSLRTPDFDTGNYLYGVGVGYQFTKHWGADLRIAHHGLDADGSAIQDIGGRLVARMPFEFLSPYTFLGASFDLERDDWHLQPGAGLELGVSKKLRGLSVFAEGGLDADLRGHNGYMFTIGLRVRGK